MSTMIGQIFSHRAERIAPERELPNAYLDEVPGSGHMVHHSHPELIAKRVDHVFARSA
jgi:pimeloyl-ACP methyl ester carboxylesterase